MAILFDGNTQVGGVTTVGTTIEDKTMAEFNALTPEQQSNGDYCITDLDLVPLKAENVPISAISGMSANNVQSGIEELNSILSSNKFQRTDTLFEGDSKAIGTNGVYRVAENTINMDGKNNGILVQFIPMNNVKAQIYFDSSTGGIFTRVCWYGTWRNWS